MDKVTANDNTADTANDNKLMMTDHSETADRMEEWEDQIQMTMKLYRRI